MTVEPESETAVEKRDTDRTEAFSDGIFAFAITLLVLNLRDPASPSDKSLLWGGLVGQWPALFALITSFATILIMWVNHHNMFNHITKVDTRFMFLNGTLLFFVVITPFTTLIVADHALSPENLPNSPDAKAAAALYSAGFLFLAIVWNVLWRYSSKENRLLPDSEPDDHVATITRTYYWGPIFYTIAFVVSLFEAIFGVLAILLVAVYFTVNATVGEHN